MQTAPLDTANWQIEGELDIPTFNGRPARQIYLDTIGLTKLDPFATPVAEQELALSVAPRPSLWVAPLSEGESRTPTFFEFVSPPPLSGLPAGQTIQQVLGVLREPRSAFLYGPPGIGKTTLRLALEADCRRRPDRILVISYPLTADLNEPPNLEAHWSQLAEALAIDLFIQIVEQFSPLDPEPMPAQIDALRTQIRIGGHGLRRLAERILDEPEPEALVGLGLLWPAVDRPAVRRVVRSTALINLLHRSLQDDTPSLSSPVGEQAILAGLQATDRWGFQKAFVLVDGVDTRRRDHKFMLALIRPLLNALPKWESHHLFFKFFLPLELRTAVSTAIKRMTPHLTSQPFESIIGPWNSSSLQKLLAERFRVGGSRRVGFGDLAVPELRGQLDGLLIQAARGSPRRLLQIISRLIDTHAIRDPHDRLISLADWNYVSQRLSSDPLLRIDT